MTSTTLVIQSSCSSKKGEITFGSGSPLLRLEHEELVGAGFSAPDFALAARELPYTGVGVV